MFAAFTAQIAQAFNQASEDVARELVLSGFQGHIIQAPQTRVFEDSEGWVVAVVLIEHGNPWSQTGLMLQIKTHRYPRGTTRITHVGGQPYAR